MTNYDRRLLLLMLTTTNYGDYPLSDLIDRRLNMLLETPLMIECGDVQIDAIGYYDSDSGCLESVTINKRNLTIAQVSAALFILCPDDVDPWADDLDGDTLNVLLNEAASYAACERADHRRALMQEE